MAEWNDLLEEAKRLVSEEPRAMQVILVHTAKGNVYHFANTCISEPEEEEAFLELLQEKDDTQILGLICMWNNFQIDVPSMRFRKRLLEICSRNDETQILLQGEYVLAVRTLRSTMPA